jgi:serine/threonine protein kinase/Tfp pilus assembly protein PilF
VSTTPNRDRWSRISRLFATAVELSPKARSSFLHAECGDGDEALRHDVEQLIAAHERSGGLLDLESAEGTPKELLPPGTRIPPYEIGRLLGGGGMGEVYEAHRDEPLQRVALKLIKRGMESDLVVHRFLREREILASLEHPNIARLIDGGRTPDGRPFLVMERVDGEPLDRYCDERRLPVRKRLELFLVVCEAVNYAHQKLVVHRDIKPSNVFVTADGVVKLMDFGTAKILTPEAADELTEVGARCLTPSYASPEQLRGGAITTATDVFGLGGLLHALLLDQPPRRLPRSDFVAALDELGRSEEPELPSRFLKRRERGEIEALAARRATSPPRLARLLRGDLDTIVTKALAHAPESRYGSVEQLAVDVRRHLAGLPLTARRASVLYRASRFGRRHWRGLTAAVALGASVLATLVSETSRARDIAAERDLAKLERTRADEVSSFLVDLFEVIDPEAERLQALTAREALDRGVQQVGRELLDQPETRAALLVVLARAYRKLGYYERAAELAEEGFRLYRQDGREQTREAASALEEWGRSLLRLSRSREARQLFRHAAVLRVAVGGSNAGDLSNSLLGLAMAALNTGDWSAARRLGRRGLALEEATENRDPAWSVDLLHTVAIATHYLGDYDGASQLYEEALATARSALGEGHLEVANLQTDYGQLLLRVGDLAAAEEGLTEALALYRERLGPDHQYVGIAAGALGGCKIELGELVEAEPLLQEAARIARRYHGESGALYGVPLHNLGHFAYVKGDDEEAERLLTAALAVYEESLGPDHPHVATTLHYLGAIARRRGDLSRARELADRALEIRRRALEPDHPALAASLHEEGLLHLAQNDARQAETLLRQALDIRRRVLRSDHWAIAESLLALGRLLADSGRRAEALALVREAKERRRHRVDRRAPHPQEIAALERALESAR